MDLLKLWQEVSQQTKDIALASVKAQIRRNNGVKANVYYPCNIYGNDVFLIYSRMEDRFTSIQSKGDIVLIPRIEVIPPALASSQKKPRKKPSKKSAPK